MMKVIDVTCDVSDIVIDLKDDLIGVEMTEDFIGTTL